jgi:hypothetical protein
MTHARIMKWHRGAAQTTSAPRMRFAVSFALGIPEYVGCLMKPAWQQRARPSAFLRRREAPNVVARRMLAKV